MKARAHWHSGLGRRRRSLWLGAILLISVAAALGAALLPSPASLQSRVQALVAARGDDLLPPPGVPTLLAQAVIPIEVERVYRNQGVGGGSIGRGCQHGQTELLPARKRLTPVDAARRRGQGLSNLGNLDLAVRR